MANEIRLGVRTLNLSATQLKGMTRDQGAEWSNELINDYLTILDNFIRIASATDDIIEQVDENTAAIIVNRDNIQVNVENILINKEAIELVALNLQEHEDDRSVHGVTGTVVGTGNFPTELVGGAVLKSELVNNAVIATTEITTPDVIAAGASYTQAYAQSQTDLINEEKAKINDIITDLGGIVTQFNDLLAKAKTAEQMTP